MAVDVRGSPWIRAPERGWCPIAHDGAPAEASWSLRMKIPQVVLMGLVAAKRSQYRDNPALVAVKVLAEAGQLLPHDATHRGGCDQTAN